jgi:hypothetical protein
MKDQLHTTADKTENPLTKYSHSLAQWLKRSTRSSLVVSHSVLAFVLTMMIQIRLQGAMEYSKLARAALVCLSLAVIIGYYVQARIGSKRFLLEVMKWGKEMSEEIEEMMTLSEDDEKRVHQRRKAMKDYIEDANTMPLNRIPGIAIMLQWISIGVGVVLAIVYFWTYLFC